MHNHYHAIVVALSAASLSVSALSTLRPGVLGVVSQAAQVAPIVNLEAFNASGAVTEALKNLPTVVESAQEGKKVRRTRGFGKVHADFVKHAKRQDNGSYSDSGNSSSTPSNASVAEGSSGDTSIAKQPCPDGGQPSSGSDNSGSSSGSGGYTSASPSSGSGDASMSVESSSSPNASDTGSSNSSESSSSTPVGSDDCDEGGEDGGDGDDCDDDGDDGGDDGDNCDEGTGSPSTSSSSSQVSTTAAAPVASSTANSGSGNQRHHGSSSTSTSSATSASSSTSSSSSGSNSGSGTVYSGMATFFYQEGAAGACGNYNQDSTPLVAIDIAMYDNGKWCGKTVVITRTSTGKSITAIVADECPGCSSSGSLDLSTGAYDQLGTEDEGTFPITWQFAN